ncbi:MAG: Rieske (2Fe-2S) protein [Rubripirellula sp.]|nr:Rieske (2Fe-2S) protein [Rubripirellula sp.]
MSRKKSESTRNWVTLDLKQTIVDGHAREVMVGDRVIALFRSEGQLFAMDGMCAHQGGPIAEGQLQHGCVTCPWHGWQYELATGIQTINRQPLQETFEVREIDGKIELFI